MLYLFLKSIFIFGNICRTCIKMICYLSHHCYVQAVLFPLMWHVLQLMKHLQLASNCEKPTNFPSSFSTSQQQQNPISYPRTNKAHPTLVSRQLPDLTCHPSQSNNSPQWKSITKAKTICFKGSDNGYWTMVCLGVCGGLWVCALQVLFTPSHYTWLPGVASNQYRPENAYCYPPPPPACFVPNLIMN